MTRLTRTLTILCLLCIPTILSGCLVVSDCGEVEVCEQTCDGSGCFEECWIEEDPYCGGGGYSDDYYSDDYYSDDSTDPTVVEARGEAGFCQACEKDLDCVEPGALCIQINGTENVCARTCNSDSPCPRGFECRDISQQAGVSDQCVPIADPNDDNTRSCVVPEEAECLEDVDCANGEWCDQIDGQCVIGERPECQYNSQCEEGLICTDEGKCVEKPEEPVVTNPTCDENVTCDEGTVCVDGQCVEPAEEPAPEEEPATCLTNTQCGEGEFCIDGQCTSPVQSCEADSDCDGQICADNICAAPECTNNNECAEGGLCVNARCEKSCDLSEDCGFGYICNDLNYCENDPEVACRADDECAEGFSCLEGACEAI